MNTFTPSKLNYLLQHWLPGMVMTDQWLKLLGINKDLKHRYIRSKWLTSIGHGAVIRSGDKVSWLGGISALQMQVKVPIHIAGRTALELVGFGHFIKFDTKEVIIFKEQDALVQKWFTDYDWGVKLSITSSNFLEEGVALDRKEFAGIEVILSSPERAILELLYFVPQKQGCEECYLIMENLISLRPHILQQLLERCKSVKVKRLFLFLASKLNHPWFERLDLRRIDLGSGSRSIVTGGAFNSKYKITVPRSLAYEEDI